MTLISKQIDCFHYRSLHKYLGYLHDDYKYLRIANRPPSALLSCPPKGLPHRSVKRSGVPIGIGDDGTLDKY